MATATATATTVSGARVIQPSETVIFNKITTKLTFEIDLKAGQVLNGLELIVVGTDAANEMHMEDCVSQIILEMNHTILVQMK